MIIGTKRLLELVNNPEVKLVENLCERELNNPEGAGFDLRIDEFFKLDAGEIFLGVDVRKAPKEISVAKYGTHKDYVLKPGEYVLVKTIESLNLPNNIGSLFRPRSSLQRGGVALYTANANPGYRGGLVFAMHNFGTHEFRFEMGARFAHALFYETSENVSAYRGQHQGGRVSVGGSERQV